MNREIARNCDEAKLKHDKACVEGIDYNEKRYLDKVVMRNLATCQ